MIDEKPSSTESPVISTTSPEQLKESLPFGTGIKCQASNGKFCRFPFKFKGRVFASCTTEFDPDQRAWCSTKGKRYVKIVRKNMV